MGVRWGGRVAFMSTLPILSGLDTHVAKVFPSGLITVRIRQYNKPVIQLADKQGDWNEGAYDFSESQTS